MVLTGHRDGETRLGVQGIERGGHLLGYKLFGLLLIHLLQGGGG
jgi:hypothetical protein